MHTSDLVAQVTSLIVASVGMVAATLISRRYPAVPHAPAADAERPK